MEPAFILYCWHVVMLLTADYCFRTVPIIHVRSLICTSTSLFQLICNGLYEDLIAAHRKPGQLVMTLNATTQWVQDSAQYSSTLQESLSTKSLTAWLAQQYEPGQEAGEWVVMLARTHAQ